MSLKIRIMVKAVKIRMDRGESLEEILGSYPRLTEDEKATISREIEAGDTALLQS